MRIERWSRPGLAMATGLVLLVLIPEPTEGQGAEGNSAVPRTLWGEADLSGLWDFRTLTPLERPAELAGKEVLTDDEAAEYERKRLHARDKDRRPSDGISVALDLRNAYNQFWWDYGTKLTEDKRTSLIVDPTDGRILPLTPPAQERADFSNPDLENLARGPEDRDVGERCIVGFNAGPPMNPSAYNNNVHIFQTQDYIVILNEMVHDARIVPMDGAPAYPSARPTMER